MSLLTIVQDATNRIGVPQPSSAIDSADVTTRQFVSFAQQEVRELARFHPWQVLQKEKDLHRDGDRNAVKRDPGRLRPLPAPDVLQPDSKPHRVRPPNAARVAGLQGAVCRGGL